MAHLLKNCKQHADILTLSFIAQHPSAYQLFPTVSRAILICDTGVFDFHFEPPEGGCPALNEDGSISLTEH